MLPRRSYLALALCLGTGLALASISQAQVIYSSGGFEAYDLAPLSPQGPGGTPSWLTTDFAQDLGNAAGVVQSNTVFAGNRAVQIIGPNLLDDIVFSNQTFWWQDRTATPITPGSNIVRVTYRQRLNGNQGDTSQMPFAGIFLEGLLASNGNQVAITSVFIDNAERITAITTGGNSISTPTLPNIFNNWHELRVDLNFTTNRFSVFLDGVPATPLTNLPFRTGTTPVVNRLVEFGFQASTLGAGIPPTNDTFFDDFLVVGVAVPEPTTYAMIALTALGAGYWHSRRRKAAQTEAAEVVEC
jgi:hypothetical protein